MKFPFVSIVLGLVTGAASAASVADLKHRYSFDDLNDRVGDADLTLIGGATLVDGSLSLPGGAPRTNYAAAGAGLGASVNGAQNLTVEVWFTQTAAQNWSKVWMFGANTDSFIDFTPRAGDGSDAPSMGFKADGAETTTRSDPDPAVLAVGTEILATAVYDTTANTLSLYLNGLLADTQGDWTGDFSQLAPLAENFIGAAVGFNDADFDGSINELRIWTEALSPAEIAMNAASGPNVIAVPEASIALLGALGGLVLLRRRR